MKFGVGELIYPGFIRRLPLFIKEKLTVPEAYRVKQLAASR